MISILDECWEWKGCRDAKGYGMKMFRKRRPSPLRLHRVAWAWANGPIPEGLDVLHRCDNPPCVNPKHLFLGTQADNNNDRDRKGRNFHKNKTHCPHGHPYSGRNLKIQASPYQRVCRTCERVKWKKHDAKRRARNDKPL